MSNHHESLGPGWENVGQMSLFYQIYKVGTDNQIKKYEQLVWFTGSQWAVQKASTSEALFSHFTEVHFRSQKNFDEKNFWTQEELGSIKISGLNKFLVQKKFGPKKRMLFKQVRYSNMSCEACVRGWSCQEGGTLLGSDVTLHLVGVFVIV